VEWLWCSKKGLKHYFIIAFVERQKGSLKIIFRVSGCLFCAQTTYSGSLKTANKKTASVLIQMPFA
jgi:hypothetical protein